MKEDRQLECERVVTVVETLLVQFSERRQLITEYYEHWKVHVNAGKEFKSQWAQFIQDARKVGGEFWEIMEIIQRVNYFSFVLFCISICFRILFKIYS